MPKPLNSDYAFRRQNLLIEFASLKYASPQGIYMSLSPQEPRLWWGVMFVRKGPFASAILKFTVLFPTGYPAHPPIITFLSDIYHPLIVPPTPPPPPSSLSTHSSPGKSQPQPPAAHINYNQNISNLPAGSFTLKHGFPNWYSTPSPKTTTSPGSKELPPNPPLAPLEPALNSAPSIPSPSPEKEKNILQVLYYLKSVFSSVSVLDDIPPHLAANLGAWRAWRAFREASKAGGAKEESHSVWLERVNGCVTGSQTEGVLYGGMGVGRGGGGLGNEEMMRFLDIDDDAYESIKEMIAGRGTSAYAA
ncbi:hypothetical protein BGX38DRAFT_1229687 [Terfezia claveryi]|nr:hypothetical protein BGX38DRAFT_1229687 [Terfezia claveryi]